MSGSNSIFVHHLYLRVDRLAIHRAALETCAADVAKTMCVEGAHHTTNGAHKSSAASALGIKNRLCAMRIPTQLNRSSSYSHQIQLYLISTYPYIRNMMRIATLPMEAVFGFRDGLSRLRTWHVPPVRDLREEGKEACILL